MDLTTHKINVKNEEGTSAAQILRSQSENIILRCYEIIEQSAERLIFLTQLQHANPITSFRSLPNVL